MTDSLIFTVRRQLVEYLNEKEIHGQKETFFQFTEHFIHQLTIFSHMR